MEWFFVDVTQSFASDRFAIEEKRSAAAFIEPKMTAGTMLYAIFL